MASNNTPISRADSQPQPSADIIRAVKLPGQGEQSKVVLFLLIAWVASAIFHGVILFLFLFVTVGSTSAQVAMETQVINTQIDDEKPKDVNLENDDMGALDPNELLNYNNKAVKEESVPGPNINEPTGIQNMPEATPVNIPPPPGLGGSEGQGGGIDAPKAGLGNLTGLPGGMHGINVPGGFGGRSGATRADLLREGGGNTETEAAVASGQKWLVQHQAPDGHWSLDGFDQHGHCNCRGFGISNDIAATAFGLLPLLGAGETHKNPKSIYRANVDRALKYLMLKQGRDGSFGGGMYAHGLATIAMCEAYGMTSDPALKSSAQRAIDFIRSAQSESGGWRYEPRQGGDTSVVGWQVMALKSGQMAGLNVDDNRNPTLAKATKWLNSCMTADGGGYGYQGPEPTPTMTAVGLLCRLYLGTGTRNSGIRAGVERLKKAAPPTGMASMYYYYYATQVMHHVGGPDWDFWNARMRPMLVNKQDTGNTPKHPHLKGSWAPAGDVHAGSGGRLMSTSLSLLTLEVYYRHLPLYRRDLGGTKIAAN
jgi:hypothetical protein